MALTPTGAAIIFISIVAGLAALLWPAPGANAGDTACPLGYGGSAQPQGLHPFSRRLPKATLYHNATFWTADAQNMEAAALLVDGSGGIIDVGGLEQVLARRSAEWNITRASLGGGYVLPGLVDAHVHLLPAGLFMAQAQLAGAQSKRAFQQAVAAAAGALPEGHWLRGGGWDEGAWGGQLPDASWLDEVVGQRPALLTRMDGHMALVSSTALRLANITPDTAAPPGGVIDRLPDGRPSGLLRDTAMALVAGLVPPPSVEARRAALQAAAALALSRGVTTVGDMGRGPFAMDAQASWHDLEEVYLPAADSKQLPLRVATFMPLSQGHGAQPLWPRLAARVAVQGRSHDGGRLFWGGAKEFADGSLGSKTALMWEAYSDDDAGSSGVRVTPVDKLRELAQGAHAAGLQLAVHAIGDRAVDEVLDIYAGLSSIDGGGGSGDKAAAGGGSGATSSGQQPLCRHRIEHVQHVSSGQAVAARCANLSVQAVPNPLHLLSDAPTLVSRLGAERLGGAFAFRSLLEAGAPTAFASDWPVVDLQPLHSLYAAVARRPPPDGPSSGSAPQGEADGGAPWQQLGSQGISAQQALLGHTLAAAQALCLGDYVGALKPGMRADFVVLSEAGFLKGSSSSSGTPEAAAVGSFGSHDSGGQAALPRVLQTFLDGVCVHGCGG